VKNMLFLRAFSYIFIRIEYYMINTMIGTGLVGVLFIASRGWWKPGNITIKYHPWVTSLN